MADYQVTYTKEYVKALRHLKEAGKRDIMNKAHAAQTAAAMHGEISLERTHHGESRLENCEKFDLGGAYRLVVQLVDPGSKHRVFLFVGSHEETERWIEARRNYKWVHRPSDGKLEFVQVTTPETRTYSLIEPRIDVSESLLDRPLLRDLAASDFASLGVPKSIEEYSKGITGNDWAENHRAILEYIENKSSIEDADLFCDLFSHAYEAEAELLRGRIALRAGQASVAEVSERMLAAKSDVNAENFITWDDSEGLDPNHALLDWILFLHPAQRRFAMESFDGPFRLRGVSGSGKTCVLVHRARMLARTYGQTVAVVTLAESMRKLLHRMLTELCGVEAAHIESYTISGFVKSILERHHPKANRYYTFVTEGMAAALRKEAISTVLEDPDVAQTNVRFLPDRERYVLEKIQHIRQRYPRRQFNEFLGEPVSREDLILSLPVRKALIKAAETWETRLQERHQRDYEGLVQDAFELLVDDKVKLPAEYRCVLIDEVQDVSQMELRFLACLRGPGGEMLSRTKDGLFLVGDGAQTIYRRGFRLSHLGIDVRGGRSAVLRKNYRNTRQILRAAHALVAPFEYADIDEDNICAPVSPDLAAREGDEPLVVSCRNEEDESEFIAHRIEALIRQEIPPGQICVISPSPNRRRACQSALERRRIRYAELKEDADFDSPFVKVSTIESAKGHEFHSVFIAGMNRGVLPSHKADDDPSELAREAARLYVAMTRATHLLLITYSRSMNERPSPFLASIREHVVENRWTDGHLELLRVT